MSRFVVNVSIIVYIDDDDDRREHVFTDHQIAKIIAQERIKDVPSAMINSVVKVD